MQIVIILSTWPGDRDPSSFARTLVAENLVACVNILPPMQSIYRWDGNVEHAVEHQLVMKTTTARVAEVKARLTELHPYDVPEILVLPVSDGGDAYLQWVESSTTTE